jgi:hypothetical protein
MTLTTTLRVELLNVRSQIEHKMEESRHIAAEVVELTKRRDELLRQISFRELEENDENHD